MSVPATQALVHGLNRAYYSLVVSYRKNELEMKMLMNLSKKRWSHGLQLKSFGAVEKANESTMGVRGAVALLQLLLLLLL